MWAFGVRTTPYYLFPIPFLLLALALPVSANHFDDTMKRVRLLSNSPNVRLLPFGKSAQRRPIPAFVISNFDIDPANKARLLVVAGQHGDEYNPVKAVLTLSRELAAGAHKDLINGCVIVIIPMANPDGIATANRFNGAGLDLNRDWLDRSALETRYVHSIIKTWRPQAIIDTHEWTGPSLVPANGVELARSGKETQYEAMAGVSEQIARVGGLALIKDTGRSDGRLLHRRYSAMGYASYLIETAPGEDYSVKAHAYTAAVEQVAETLVSRPKLRQRLSPSSVVFNPMRVSAYLEPTPMGSMADPQSSALAFAATAMAAYCLIVWILKPIAVKKETAWSRKFRRCSIDWDVETHPLTKKRALLPLTSRSWTHRRLRSRYKVEPTKHPRKQVGLSY